MDRLEQIGENLKYGYTMARHGTQEGIRLQMLKDIRYLYSEIRMKKWFEKRMEFLSKLSDRLNDELQNCQHLRKTGDGLIEQQCLDCGELL